jgi:hypothetical protein
MDSPHDTRPRRDSNATDRFSKPETRKEEDLFLFEAVPGRKSSPLRNDLNLGYYLFQEDDVIGDGDTIEGIEPGSCWRCRHEASLLEPQRVVLDHGSPLAASSRKPAGEVT